ncbi:unnamed protein product [Moneuplotes crassus]|uniref:Uncharacterized protein n=1 Tax=Euplotes crassus TaxID=5936 RepID=A0AAD1XTV1_EUPCR|nr:unnamed protein product [Moneuplotes crassus]
MEPSKILEPRSVEKSLLSKEDILYSQVYSSRNQEKIDSFATFDSKTKKACIDFGADDTLQKKHTKALLPKDCKITAYCPIQPNPNKQIAKQAINSLAHHKIHEIQFLCINDFIRPQIPNWYSRCLYKVLSSCEFNNIQLTGHQTVKFLYNLDQCEDIKFAECAMGTLEKEYRMNKKFKCKLLEFSFCTHIDQNLSWHETVLPGLIKLIADTPLKDSVEDIIGDDLSEQQIFKTYLEKYKLQHIKFISYYYTL